MEECHWAKKEEGEETQGQGEGRGKEAHPSKGHKAFGLSLRGRAMAKDGVWKLVFKQNRIKQLKTVSHVCYFPFEVEEVWFYDNNSISQAFCYAFFLANVKPACAPVFFNIHFKLLWWKQHEEQLATSTTITRKAYCQKKKNLPRAKARVHILNNRWLFWARSAAETVLYGLVWENREHA